MREWTYASSGGEMYPVRSGEIWQAGRHYLGCGDLECGAAARLLQTCGCAPDIVYTDPPWNAGNAASFRTKAKVPRKVQFTDFLTTLIGAIRDVRQYAFIEMGRKNAPLLASIIEQHGGTVLWQWPITYYGKHPAELFCVTWTGQPHPICDLSGMDDEVTPYHALSAVRGDSLTVFDPCLGRGNTARAAERLNMASIGMELSPWRLSAALHSLARTGLQVSRCGALEEAA